MPSPIEKMFNIQKTLFNNGENQDTVWLLVQIVGKFRFLLTWSAHASIPHSWLKNSRYKCVLFYHLSEWKTLAWIALMETVNDVSFEACNMAKAKRKRAIYYTSLWYKDKTEKKTKKKEQVGDWKKLIYQPKIRGLPQLLEQQPN